MEIELSPDWERIRRNSHSSSSLSDSDRHDSRRRPVYANERIGGP